MALISDKFHEKKLKELNLNIETDYIVGNKILKRNTDGSINDDITKGIRCKKNYYIAGKLVHTEKLFDSRIEYTFISKEMENSEYKCPNCGMRATLKDFTEGCPFCRTLYNIDYTDKDLGSKYHYDLVLRKKTYRVITGIVDVVISLVLMYTFLKTTSRTFNAYDIFKVYLYAAILASILYYFFYIIDGYIILTPIKAYKNAQNARQMEFWNRTKVDKKTFFNNLNYEVKKYYYSKKDIVDYDILDYIEFREYYKKDTMYVDVQADVRVVRCSGGKVSSQYKLEKFTIKKLNRDLYILEDGANMIKCHNCGASIDVTKGYCQFCKSKTNYYQEWIME